jgi:hypothetical protein
MTDELNKEILDAAQSYRSAGRVPRDEIWEKIAPVVLAGSRRRSRLASPFNRIARFLPVHPLSAAALVTFGILLGAAGDNLLRYGSPSGAPPAVRTQVPEVASHLASADSLIRVFTLASTSGRVRSDLEPWARELVEQNRSVERTTPTSDKALRTLLRDLDLVLEQIAQYAALPGGNNAELDLIEDAIRARQLSDQLRFAVGTSTAGS